MADRNLRSLTASSDIELVNSFDRTNLVLQKKVQKNWKNLKEIQRFNQKRQLLAD